VYPDNRGFLRGYKGDQPVIEIDLDPPGLDGPAEWDGLDIVDAAVFMNRFGVKVRTFITSDWQAWRMAGARPVKLHTFNGRVKMLQFQDIVIFMSNTQPPRKWDGVEGCTTLGVSDVPRAPEVRLALGGHGMWGEYFRQGHTWGINDLVSQESPEDNPNPQYTPHGPCQDRDPITDNQMDKMFEWAVSYYNTRGQVGRRSAPTSLQISRSGDVDADRRAFDGVDGRRWNFAWPIVEWLPDYVEPDIAGVVVWRTTNEAVAETVGLFQVAYVLPLPLTRITDTKPDGALGLAYDDTKGEPGPSGTIACVYKDTVFIAGDTENNRVVRYCTAGTPEDWPVLNAYQASDEITAILPLSKSVIIVTKSSIETIIGVDGGLYALSRVEETKGSIFGQTLAVYKDNVIGFFNSGFGIFDGFTFKQLNNTLGHLADEIDVDLDAFTWVSPDGMFFVNTLTRGVGRQTLVFHFAFNSWFRLDQSGRFCVWTEDDQVYLGGSGNIVAYNCAESGGGTIEFIIGGLEEDAPALSWFNKSLGRVFLNLESIGSWNYTVSAWADEDLAKPPFFTGVIKASQDGDTLFDDDRYLWDEGAHWTGPRFNWRALQCGTGANSWHNLRLQIDWTGDIKIAGLAMELTYSDAS